MALGVQSYLTSRLSRDLIVAAQERLSILAEVEALRSPELARPLAKLLLEQHLLPRKAALDALHVAIAAVQNIDFLLTWNCKHIANAQTRDRIATTIRSQGYNPPVLCTPEELMGGDDD